MRYFTRLFEPAHQWRILFLTLGLFGLEMIVIGLCAASQLPKGIMSSGVLPVTLLGAIFVFISVPALIDEDREVPGSP
jgi:hypothetical protein